MVVYAPLDAGAAQRSLNRLSFPFGRLDWIPHQEKTITSRRHRLILEQPGRSFLSHRSSNLAGFSFIFRITCSLRLQLRLRYFTQVIESEHAIDFLKIRFTFFVASTRILIFSWNFRLLLLGHVLIKFPGNNYSN